VREGSSGVAEAPRIVAEPDDEQRLVAAVRRGDERAFEALYARYHRRIAAYVLGMVKDHGRAEDVTQEVFVSALRRMRATERPIAFKPWIYEIAKNACIDQYRRSRRAEEVSYDADDGLAPGDYGRLVGSDPTPDAAVAAKQDLDHLCGAFGGLSDTHHEILVLRELEGLSYREIGERMGMSRPAVESTLFRARRRLTEEYDELVSGARCRRVQDLIATAAGAALGTRESNRLARHVAHCQPCRREAFAAGLDSSVLTHVPLRRRAAEKIAALLPIPWLARFGRGRGPGDEAAATMAGSSPGWVAQLPLISEQAGAGWGKLAAVAAVAIAGFGAAGVGTQVGKSHNAQEPRPAAQQGTGAREDSAAAGGAATRAAANSGAAGRENGARRGAADRTEGRRGTKGERTVPVRDGAPAAGVAPAAQPGTSATAPATETPAAGGTTGGPSTPSIGMPVAGDNPAGPVVNGVQEAVDETADGVGGTTDETVGGVGGTVEGVVGGAGGTVEGAVGGAGGTVEGAVGGAGGTVGGAAGGAGGTVGGAAGGAGGTVGGAVGGSGQSTPPPAIPVP
jgi:RNA polymerase sigma factor (sigma-70 family)